MTPTKIPGLCARHIIIKDACRELRGDKGAIDEALGRARDALEKAIKGWGPPGRGMQLHVVVTVERPPKEGD